MLSLSDATPARADVNTIAVGGSCRVLAGDRLRPRRDDADPNAVTLGSGIRRLYGRGALQSRDTARLANVHCAVATHTAS